MNSGVYLHAPEHGRNTWVGMKINLFHQNDRELRPESPGSIFPLVAPLAVNVKNQGEWNALRVLMDWPRLQVWMNDTQVQDLDVETVPELRHRLRRGYLGFESLSYPIRFRNIRVRELPAKETWDILYDGPDDFAKWQISSGKPTFEPRGAILRGDGNGQLATRETYRDFVLHMYAPRGAASQRRRDVSVGAERPDGTRSAATRSSCTTSKGRTTRPGRSIRSNGRSIRASNLRSGSCSSSSSRSRRCLVRINGETVLEYDGLQNLEAGRIELQAHHPGRWLEFKQIKIRRL